MVGRTIFTLLLALLVSAVLACDDETEPTDGDADSDVDSDADMDGDVDSDVDSDGDGDRDVDSDTDLEADVETDAVSDAEATADGDTASDADAPSDADEPDGSSCEPATRCRSRMVEACVPGSREFREVEVCERTERCVTGACEELPADYGVPCRSAEDAARCARAGLECGGPAAVPFCLRPGVPIALGGECWGHRDCELGLICSREGFCQRGAAGDPCREAEDCTSGLACTTDDICG